MSFRCRLWDTWSICGWICPRLQWVFSRPKCKSGPFLFLENSDCLGEELIKPSYRQQIKSFFLYWMSCSAFWLLFFSFFSAYLCDQRKWEDEIQDLKKKKRIAKETTSTYCTSCNSKPEHFPWDSIHFHVLSKLCEAFMF